MSKRKKKPVAEQAPKPKRRLNTASFYDLIIIKNDAEQFSQAFRDNPQLLSGLVPENEIVPPESTVLHLLVTLGSKYTEMLEEVLQIAQEHKVALNIDARNSTKETAVYCCARINNPSALARLLTGGADPNIPDDNGCTPLMMAAGHGYSQMTTMLLEGSGEVHEDSDEASKDFRKVANVNAQATDGLTALLAAIALSKNIGCMQLLIEAGANVNLGSSDMSCPLYEVIREGTTEMAALLLETQAIDFHRKYFGSSEFAAPICQYALLKGLATNNLNFFSMIFLFPGVDTILHSQTAAKVNILDVAAMYDEEQREYKPGDFYSTVKKVLQLGYNPEDNREEMQLLVERHHLSETNTIMLKYAAEYHLILKEVNVAYYWPQYYKQIAKQPQEVVVRELPQLYDKQWIDVEAMLFWGILAEHSETILTAFRLGAKFSCKNVHGDTPIKVALLYQKLGSLNTLVSFAKAELDLDPLNMKQDQNDKSSMPLVIAAKLGEIGMIDWLLQAGATVGHQAALGIAASRDDKPLVKLLSDHFPAGTSGAAPRVPKTQKLVKSLQDVVLEIINIQSNYLRKPSASNLQQAHLDACITAIEQQPDVKQLAASAATMKSSEYSELVAKAYGSSVIITNIANDSNTIRSLSTKLNSFTPLERGEVPEVSNHTPDELAIRQNLMWNFYHLVAFFRLNAICLAPLGKVLNVFLVNVNDEGANDKKKLKELKYFSTFFYKNYLDLFDPTVYFFAAVGISSIFSMLYYQEKLREHFSFAHLSGVFKFFINSDVPSTCTKPLFHAVECAELFEHYLELTSTSDYEQQKKTVFPLLNRYLNHHFPKYVAALANEQHNMVKEFRAYGEDELRKNEHYYKMFCFYNSLNTLLDHIDNQMQSTLETIDDLLKKPFPPISIIEKKLAQAKKWVDLIPLTHSKELNSLLEEAYIQSLQERYQMILANYTKRKKRYDLVYERANQKSLDCGKRLTAEEQRIADRIAEIEAKLTKKIAHVRGYSAIELLVDRRASTEEVSHSLEAPAPKRTLEEEAFQLFCQLNPKKLDETHLNAALAAYGKLIQEGEAQTPQDMRSIVAGNFGYAEIYLKLLGPFYINAQALLTKIQNNPECHKGNQDKQNEILRLLRYLYGKATPATPSVVEKSIEQLRSLVNEMERLNYSLTYWESSYPPCSEQKKLSNHFIDVLMFNRDDPDNISVRALSSLLEKLTPLAQHWYEHRKVFIFPIIQAKARNPTKVSKNRSIGLGLKYAGNDGKEILRRANTLFEHVESSGPEQGLGAYGKADSDSQEDEFDSTPKLTISDFSLEKLNSTTFTSENPICIQWLRQLSAYCKHTYLIGSAANVFVHQHFLKTETTVIARNLDFVIFIASDAHRDFLQSLGFTRNTHLTSVEKWTMYRDGSVIKVLVKPCLSAQLEHSEENTYIKAVDSYVEEGMMLTAFSLLVYLHEGHLRYCDYAGLAIKDTKAGCLRLLGDPSSKIQHHPTASLYLILQQALYSNWYFDPATLSAIQECRLPENREEQNHLTYLAKQHLTYLMRNQTEKLTTYIRYLMAYQLIATFWPTVLEGRDPISAINDLGEGTMQAFIVQLDNHLSELISKDQEEIIRATEEGSGFTLSLR